MYVISIYGIENNKKKKNMYVPKRVIMMPYLLMFLNLGNIDPVDVNFCQPARRLLPTTRKGYMLL